jgi:hypothetical protein
LAASIDDFVQQLFCCRVVAAEELMNRATVHFIQWVLSGRDTAQG